VIRPPGLSPNAGLRFFFLKFGIKHKILVSFLIAIGFVLFAGLLIDRTVRHYDEVVKGISAAGWEIRTAKEILNQAREMRVLLHAIPGETTRVRAQRRLNNTHIRIQDSLDRLAFSASATEDVRVAYGEYWDVILKSITPTGEDAAPPLGNGEALDAQLVLLLDRIERFIYRITETSIEEMAVLYDATADAVTFERLFRLPESYHRAMGDLIASFDHIFVYDEIWTDVLELQVNAFEGLRGNDPVRRERVVKIVENLNLWLESEVRGPNPIEGIRPFQREEKELFSRLREWINEYPRQLLACREVARADIHDCYLDAFERVAAIQGQIVRHSLDEARHVEANMSTASESIVAVARTYTLFFFGISLLAGIIAYYLFIEVLGPIQRLRLAFEQFGEGRFNHRIAERRHDEFGPLHAGFNTMAVAVERRDHELMAARIDLENLAFKIQNYSEDLEQEVRKRTAELVRAYEELKRNDRLKSEFIANMSHELRTPLNSIIGFSKVILKGIDGPITDRQKEDLLLINQSGRHLLDLITQILDFSKLEAGRFDLRLESVELQRVAEEVTSSLRSLIKGRPIDFGYVCSHPGMTVRADRTRLLQIVMNLLSNSLKFTDRGEVRLDIRPWDASDTIAPSEPVAFDHGVLISVWDTGIGIPKESAEVIFQKFHQVDGSSTRAYGGTGLGLAITRELVVMHGGYIWFTSSVGEGSTFYVLLPLEGSERTQPETTGAVLEEPGP